MAAQLAAIEDRSSREGTTEGLLVVPVQRETDVTALLDAARTGVRCAGSGHRADPRDRDHDEYRDRDADRADEVDQDDEDRTTPGPRTRTTRTRAPRPSDPQRRSSSTSPHERGAFAVRPVDPDVVLAALTDLDRPDPDRAD